MQFVAVVLEVVDLSQKDTIMAGNIVTHLTVNALLATPSVAAGVLSLVSKPQPVHDIWALSLVVIGALIGLLGFYASISPSPAIDVLEGEEIYDQRNPSRKRPLVVIAIGVLLFSVYGYLILFTESSLILLFVVNMAAAWIYLKGIANYWINQCTTYFVTNRRIVHIYQFFWKRVNELDVEDINSVREPGQSPIDRIVRIGRLRIVVGGGGPGQVIVFHDIDAPGEMRNIVNSVRHAPTVRGNRSIAQRSAF